MTEIQRQLLSWVVSAVVRAVKTAAQSALGVIGASVAMGEVDWSFVASAACLAAIVSVLTSVAGVPEAADGASVAKIARGKATD